MQIWQFFLTFMKFYFINFWRNFKKLMLLWLFFWKCTVIRRISCYTHRCSSAKSLPGVLLRFILDTNLDVVKHDKPLSYASSYLRPTPCFRPSGGRGDVVYWSHQLLRILQFFNLEHCELCMGPPLTLGAHPLELGAHLWYSPILRNLLCLKSSRWWRKWA